jgi:hypothetical protein
MDTRETTERLDEILDLLSQQTDGAQGGLSEPRRKVIVRLVKLLRDELLKSGD